MDDSMTEIATNRRRQKCQMEMTKHNLYQSFLSCVKSKDSKYEKIVRNKEKLQRLKKG